MNPRSPWTNIDESKTVDGIGPTAGPAAVCSDSLGCPCP